MPTYVYVSNAADGTIGMYEMARATGALGPLGSVPAGPNVMPMAVSPDKRHLYAAVRSAPYQVVTFAIDAATGHLSRQAAAALPESMCYIAVDKTGRHLLQASYGGNVAAVSPIGEDGLVIAAAVQTLPTGKHAHAIVLDQTETSAYVPCLGTDEVIQYRFDAVTGRLSPLSPPRVATGAGYGPRHLRFSPDNRFAYVLCELTGHVVQHERHGDGRLTAIEAVPTVQPEAGLVAGIPRGPGSNSITDAAPCVWCADLAIAPDGRFMYATERTTSTIACLAIDKASGAMSYVDTATTETQPRGIRLTPDGRYLVASGERSEHIAVHAVDRQTGKLSLVARHAGGKGANWIEIVELP